MKLLNQKEGFPATALREINVLLSLRHENIVNVREMVVGSSMDKARSRRDLISAAHLISAISYLGVISAIISRLYLADLYGDGLHGP